MLTTGQLLYRNDKLVRLEFEIEHELMDHQCWKANMEVRAREREPFKKVGRHFNLSHASLTRKQNSSCYKTSKETLTELLTGLPNSF